jgi:Zn-dependent protease
MLRGLRLGRLHGIPVQLHWSVLVVGWLIAWSLATTAIPDAAPGHGEVAYWLAGSAGAGAFLVGLLLHELAHSLVAQRNGMTVESITLWLLGGVASLRTEAPSARVALRVAAAGPLMSLVLAAVGAAVAAITHGAGGPELVTATAIWFATISAVLAVFNLLPAFPLDGGRIYEAYLWRRDGDRRGATTRAAAAGRVIGAGLIALGLLEAALLSLVGGLWLAMVGWFLREAAVTEVVQGEVQRRLDHYTVADVMTAAPATVPAEWTAAAFVEHLLGAGQHASYPVVDAAGRVTGLLTLAAIRATPSDRWPQVLVGSLATPLARVPTVQPRDSLAVLAAALGDRADMRALVIDRNGTEPSAVTSNQLTGIVSPSDLARLLVAVELVSRSPVGSSLP